MPRSTNKKVVKKKTTTTKKRKPSKKIGSFQMNWGKDFDWFKEQAALYGMHATDFVKVAVSEYVKNNKPLIEG